MNEVTISELVREAQDKLKQIAALDSKIRWHVSRAGSGGSHKKADKDFRESVTDWFWEGLAGVKGYSETTAVKSVLETAKSFMEDDTSLEELLKELHGDDLGEED